MAVTNANDVFVHDLGDIYDAEHRFLDGQQEMVEKATDDDLKGAIQNHIEQTRQHIRNIEQVFGQLTQHEQPQRRTCDAAIGLVREAQKDIEDSQTHSACDTAINTAVIKVEHYEIASYRNLLTAAQLVGRDEAVQNLLSENLRQEEQTAQSAEQSAERLLQKATQEQGGEKSLMEWAKDKLTGQ